MLLLLMDRHLITSDAIVLASKSDAVLVVVNPGKSRRDVLKNARQQLDRASANIIGFRNKWQ